MYGAEERVLQGWQGHIAGALFNHFMKLINIFAHTYKYTLLTGLLFVQYIYQLGLLKQFSKISNLSH